MTGDIWQRLGKGLGQADAETLEAPEHARVGAALVLARDPGDGDLEFVYTRRRDDLSHHPGQISFPGGRTEPGESVEEAALREAAEEVALDPRTVTVLGRLPVFYIAPSRFWLQPVVARWDRPHELVASEAEVAQVLHVRLSTLLDPTMRRVVALSSRGTSWAWQLDARHLLWGATAVVTVALLDLLQPDWHGGQDPAAMGDEWVVQPWRGEGVTGRRPRRARLPGTPERAVEVLPRGASLDDEPPARTGDLPAEVAAAAVALAVTELLAQRDGQRRVVVLAGAGRSGHLGFLVAQRLTADAAVELVTVGPPPADESTGLRARQFNGTFPEADVFVDALVGAGLHGALAGAHREVVLALRALRAPIVSVDVPTGLHPRDGLVGDAISADVTVSLGPPHPGLLLPGLAPFVGDLYEAVDTGLVRLVPPPPEAGWRE